MAYRLRSWGSPGRRSGSTPKIARLLDSRNVARVPSRARGYFARVRPWARACRRVGSLAADVG